MFQTNARIEETFLDAILLSIHDAVAIVTLNRPEHHNAINFEMWQRLAEICARIESDQRIRVVVFRGAGQEAFSTGGDIQEFKQRRSDPWQAKIYNGKVEMALRNVSRLSKPTIAMISGFCVGGGFMLAARCDIRIAAENATFSMPVARLSTLVGYRDLERFIHIIGVGATMDLLLTASSIDAREAKAIGLCSRIFSVEELEESTLSLASHMQDLAPLAQRWHKQMVRTVLHKPDLVDLDPDESVLPDACYDTEDYAEGIRAFLEKRKPVFRGR